MSLASNEDKARSWLLLASWRLKLAGWRSVAILASPLCGDRSSQLPGGAAGFMAQMLDLAEAAARAVDAWPSAVLGPAELLQYCLAVRHASAHLLAWLAGQEQAGSGHHIWRLAAWVV